MSSTTEDFTPEQLKRIQKWLDRNDEAWLKAARKALEGDLEELRVRVSLLTKPPPPEPSA